MTTQYRHNHYVPEWYQKRFMLSEQDRYWRLDLSPDLVVKGAKEVRRHELKCWAPKRIFAEDDLYTTALNAELNTDIERFFFGELDNEGLRAVEFFSQFDGETIDHSAFETLVRYMSVQKLRTPKGLRFLQLLSGSNHRPVTLALMQRFRDLHCAIWTECVWQIVSAERSDVKFIISDHPVTVYNRKCPPLSKYCLGVFDPDIRFNATHTFFPLSLEKALVLTNLSWARNPYQNELKLRPNPDFFRASVFNFTAIQTDRFLSSDEVLLMNYVTKARALRYVAAAQKEWLYPEQHVSNTVWRKFGDGWLFMPEPRLLHMGGTMYFGYTSGHSEAFSEYGHRPWQRGFEDDRRHKLEADALLRFKAEWSLRRGRKYTARDHDFGGRRVFEDSEETTEWYREVSKRYRTGKKDRNSKRKGRGKKRQGKSPSIS